jgi:hypothetical protein
VVETPAILINPIPGLSKTKAMDHLAEANFAVDPLPYVKGLSDNFNNWAYPFGTKIIDLGNA